MPSTTYRNAQWLFALLAAGCLPREPLPGSPPTTDTVARTTGDTASTDTGSPLLPVQEPALFAFLDQQQDPSTGLLASFVDHSALPTDFHDFLVAEHPAFVYDNALAAIAWLERGAPGDDVHAALVLDALLAVQRADGSLPDIVHAQTGVAAAGSSTGNQAWAMLALLTGWEAQARKDWLLAAEHVAAHLLDPATGLQNPVGFGGYRLHASATTLSTEHNLDLYPAFSRLADALPTTAARLTVAEVREAATRARIFAESRFDPVSGVVYAGTEPDGVQSATLHVPLDTQTWSVLSLGREKWRAGYSWALTPAPDGLLVSSKACTMGEIVQGVSFSTADVADVWTEGIAQARAAARLLGDEQQADLAARTLDQLRTSAPNTDKLGLVATCTEIDTGFGFRYFNALAVGATAWAAIAAVDANPYFPGALSDGLAAHPAAALPTVSLGPGASTEAACTGFAPCAFTVAGTSNGVVGTGRSIYLLVQPVDPAVPFYFTQVATPVTVQPTGDWVADGQIGNAEYPAATGDRMRVVALVVDGAAPAAVLEVVTLDTVPGLLTTTGLLELTLR